MGGEASSNLLRGFQYLVLDGHHKIKGGRRLIDAAAAAADRGDNKKKLDRRRRTRQVHPDAIDELELELDLLKLDIATLKECDPDVGILSCGWYGRVLC